jgi:hypothetical protein
MNLISVETNVVETETGELPAHLAKQTAEAIAELSASQLMLVGGGSGAASLN